MPKTNDKIAKMLLDRLLEQFIQIEFQAPKAFFHVTFSAGITEVQTDNQEQCYEWLEIADHALYFAKKKGRCYIEIGRPGEAQTDSLRKLNIAIIDDDAIIRTMLKEYLVETMSAITNIEIRTYRNGEYFFDDSWHTQRAPFLILLDGIMPGMDGLDVLERIRALPDADMYSVIMLTGRNEEEDIVRALQLGADDYLTKPFRMGELGARIRRLLTRLNVIS